MKSLCLFLLFITVNLSFAQVLTIKPIIKNGNADSLINIVYLGDGYLPSQMDKYIADVIKINDELFNQSPYKEYKNYFNVFAIEAPSNVEGAATSISNPIDNYFGSTFGYAGIQRLLVPVKSSKVSSVLADNFPNYDQVIMVVNSNTYGGSGG